MALPPASAVEMARDLRQRQADERLLLDEAWRYLHGRQALPLIIPNTAPAEIRRMATFARVNVASIVVESLAQSLAVIGFRGRRDADNVAVWEVWQANRLDARQSGIHRAALAYGAAYAIVLPGAPVPVVRGVSPRSLTALYGADPDWPDLALERRPGGRYRLYDDEVVHELIAEGERLTHAGSAEHGAGVVPVVRFLEVEDLDRDDPVAATSTMARPEVVHDDATGHAIPLSPRGRLAAGQVGPLMDLQDQIDLTTFSLLVAQHYGAFRQRYVVGLTLDEAAKRKAGASVFWSFDDDPERIRLGEFEQTDLAGYIASREASLRHAATLSQTPVHELIGEMVNLSAEALAAAEAGRDRKVLDRQTLLGESHEQLFGLIGRFAGIEVPDDAQVRWRNTSARSVAALVDALGKAVSMLGIPPQELWEQVASVLDMSQQDVERWRATAATGDAFANLTAMLDRQVAGAE